MAMKCYFCDIDMVETEELCWNIGEERIPENAEVYSSRFTCPKCGHWERAKFRLGENKDEDQ